MIETMLDMEVLLNIIYRHAKYMQLLAGKCGAEVLDMYCSLSHRSRTFSSLLWPSYGSVLAEMSLQ